MDLELHDLASQKSTTGYHSVILEAKIVKLIYYDQ